jgi:hypothetical protein
LDSLLITWKVIGLKSRTVSKERCACIFSASLGHTIVFCTAEEENRTYFQKIFFYLNNYSDGQSLKVDIKKAIPVTGHGCL